MIYDEASSLLAVISMKIFSQMFMLETPLVHQLTLNPFEQYTMTDLSKTDWDIQYFNFALQVVAIKFPFPRFYMILA